MNDGRVRPGLMRVYTKLKAAEAISLPRSPLRVEAYIRPGFAGQLHTPSVARRCSPKLTVVAMARNEADRAHDVMRHFCALFDRVVLIDHLSDDDTARIAQSYNGKNNTEVIVLRGLDTGYYQSEYMSACANALIREAATDWIFFLDFDEFLPFLDVKTCKQALVDLADQPIIHMHWYNIALKSFDPPTLQGTTGVISTQASDFVKVAINVPILGSTPVTVCQGNHAVCLAGSDTPQIGTPAFAMFHVPIFGQAALKAKIVQGARALRETTGKDANMGFHWREMSEEIDTLMADEALIHGIALHYSRPLKDIMELVAAGKAMADTHQITLNFAQTEPAQVVAGDMPAVPTFTLDTITRVMEETFPSGAAKKREGRLPIPLYHTLPAPAAQRPSPDLTERALLAATTDIAVRSPSENNGHIPLLFAVLEVFRPRRYVELGADVGASFFAACQHMHANLQYGEAIAVGEWPEGNSDAGRRAEYSFTLFKNILDTHFSRNGKFIRGQADAVSVFEEHSIDLLYIKGQHSFTTMNTLYEAWKSRLTENSVVMIQNTGKYNAGFSVWQFFDKIYKDAAASFHCYYDNGIGVLAFGAPTTNPVISLIEEFHARPEEVELYFSRLNKKVYESARFYIS